MSTLKRFILGTFVLHFIISYRISDSEAFSTHGTIRLLHGRTPRPNSQFASEYGEYGKTNLSASNKLKTVESDETNDDNEDSSKTAAGQKWLSLPKNFMSKLRRKESSVDAMVSQNVTSMETTTLQSVDEITEEKKSEESQLLKQIKEAGTAGVISYALWELGFWLISIPFVALGYYNVVGHWPDINNVDDVAKVSAEAFAFVNFARFAVPLRIGLALSTTPWIQKNIVDTYFNKEQ